MKNSVSVVIPVYNRKPVICRAVESALRQTFKPDEIILVDDGSTDGTTEIITQLYPSVRCISIKHSGVSAARNCGIHAAAGEWIAFLDSDDEWEKDKLKIQMKDLENHPQAVFSHTQEKWIRGGKTVNPPKKYLKSGGDVFFRSLPLTMIAASTVIVKKSILVSLGGFDERMPVCEDYDLWLRIACYYPARYIDEKLTIKYGGNPDQLSLTVPFQDKWRIHSLVQLLENHSLNMDVEKKLAVKNELAKKLKIILTGLSKKNLISEMAYYEDLQKKWLG